MTDRAEVWRHIHTERATLANDLADLPEDRWSTPSLCTGLTVREVLAHLTASASLGSLRWMMGVIRCRFDFDRQVAMRLTEHLGTSGVDTLARFERVIASTTCPPLPRLAMLGEVIVHGNDIRRPLGIAGEHRTDVLTRVATYYYGSDQVVAAKSRVEALHLVATDGPFTAGTGPLVTGSTIALIMAMTGREDYCDDLTGDGVDLLRQRCSA